MPKFEKKYAGERRTAIFRARFELDQTYKAISQQARTGELVPGDKFEIPPEYVGKLCREEEKRRAGRFTSPLADKPHRDAIEELRRGLIAAAEDMLSDFRSIARKTPAKADPVRGRQIVAMVREASSLPIRKDEAPPAPGQQRDGQTNGPKTRTGPGGQLLAAMRGDKPTEPESQHEAQTRRSDETEAAHEDGAARSGSLTRVDSTAAA